MKPLQVLRSALHIQQGQAKPKPKPKLNNGRIPHEILDMIQEYLDLPDQVCLALTCRHLYRYLVSYRKESGRLLLNSTLPRRDRFPLRSNTDLANDPRIQLLHQLEDKYWQYCIECQTLHRRSVKKQSHCYNGLNMHKHCNPSTGAVDLCPCLSITPNHRQLVAACIEERLEKEVTNRVFQSGFFYRAPTEGDIVHQCTVDTYPGAEMEILTEPYLDTPVRHLSRSIISMYVQNTYVINIQAELSEALGSICPEEEPNKWLKQFFKEAGLEYSAWHGKVKSVAVAPRYVKIVTDRELGWKSWGMWQWAQNRNDR
ncbi:uncharacterized protein N7515_009115 [Penicillium bovifimosum]|uniref:F-box domain-containing protein n=1 Tax=Penicillium bovifimosum TaxID=126998 RepID=A0A9W9GJS8_9EURO|nr:uncharacterized protein N7515_009115 [Penicillium bovifimosum]KAJ5121154.1 hypothetical protein N7515_009115 [Penicillium bovifimosum]